MVFSTKYSSLSKILFLFLFLALPALLVVEEVRRHDGIYWALSIALMTIAVLSMAGGLAIIRIILASFAGVFALINTALAISFIVQGTAFNAAFFAHLDLTTLKIAWQTDAIRLSVMCLYVAAVPVVVWLITARSWRPGYWITWVPIPLKVGLVTLSLYMSYPITALLEYRAATNLASKRLTEEIAFLRAKTPVTGVELAAPKNLVLIYLESLEETYFDESLFPDLLPKLSALREDAISFSDMRQYPGTGWTIGGIVSSQCGVPLLSERHGNSILNKVDNPFSRITCLAEYLREAGYRTAYIGGASLDFAGKGNFLVDNGFDLTLGIDELPNATAHSWGMYDIDMFSHAKVLFDQLSDEESPFLLSMLTLDTHHPWGTPSPGCQPYSPDPMVMLSAVHCADQLLWDFVEHIRASPVADTTVIALVSDHLVIMGEIEERLEARPRRLLFWLIDSDRDSSRRLGTATHFDIAPTLLEAVGMKNATFAFGHSLLSHEQGRAPLRGLREADFQPFTIEALTGAVFR